MCLMYLCAYVFFHLLSEGLHNQHRVAISQKLIFFFLGSFVRFHDQLIASKSACHHQQGGFRLMEIRNHGAANLEFVRREDEFVRPAFTLFQAVVG